ncbi:EF-hand calcium-binding domain-containing protein 11-like isoform X1 [Ostrea edulis]|uniref:EF-hand calcium-binding domain-containing protein 11-like isoform X1 n=1 Tax=Ostrea edulis TaxID=37623 RepID=UPI0024AF71CB|nr:EF-hand calcium-binding domain-containing protein 11-like isoform X1 [Ostrea edulis]
MKMSVSTGFQLGSYGYNKLKRTITKEEKHLLSVVFHEADERNKGFLTREDVKVAIVELFGYKPSKYEVDQIMNNYGITYDNCIGLPLENYMTVMSEKVVSADEDENIRHTFMAFDSQCRGFLAVDDLQKAFSRVAPHIPNHTVQSCFRELDRDGDGRISYKDFDFMMKYDTKSHI